LQTECKTARDDAAGRSDNQAVFIQALARAPCGFRRPRGVTVFGARSLPRSTRCAMLIVVLISRLRQTRLLRPSKLPPEQSV
jgi:hypothetical protein